MKRTYRYSPENSGSGVLPLSAETQSRDGSATSRRGFTFTEIMFAVMILGIGFIMIAAMFPVAIQQTQVTQEESAAAGVAQMAMQYMQGAPTVQPGTTPPVSLYPDYNNQWKLNITPTPVERIQPLPITLTGAATGPLVAWDMICGSMIFRQDPRYAWVPLYRRRAENNYAQVVFFVVQARATDSFINDDFVPNGSNQDDQASYPALFPRKVIISNLICGSTYTPAVPDTIEFDTTVDPNMLAPGAFVVIGRTLANNAGDMPTRIYRLGNLVDLGNLRLYELAPGFGTSSGSEKVANVEGWMMGRQQVKDGNKYVYKGPAMDIGCYSSFIMLK